MLWVPVLGHLNITLGGAFLVLYVFGAFGVAKGRQAGRILATIGLGLAYLPLLPYSVLGFGDDALNSTAYALIDLAGIVISVISLAQMYHPRTSRYIHLVTVARSSPPLR